MRRILFNIAAGISLLLLVATIVYWVRSYPATMSMSQRDRISFTHEDPLYWIISYPGKAVLCRQTGSDWSFAALPEFHLLGIRFGGGRGRDGSMIWNLQVPYWLLTLFAAVLPSIWLIAWRKNRLRQRRERRGCCPACGYDLRATPGRCPECGLESQIANL